MSMTIGSFSNGVYANDVNMKLYQRLATGKRINAAADDAAGMAIAKKLEKMVNSLGKATNNAYDMQGALNVADGAMQNVADSISRIRELSVQAANGINTASDRQIIQTEINQLLDHIEYVGNSAEFNTIKLLDGSFTNMNAQVSPGADGNMSVSIGSSLLSALGLSGYDVTSGNIDFSALDSALDTVMSNIADVGAQYNRLGYTINYNETARLNQEAARSRIEDQDMAQGMIELNRQRALSQYSLAMQKNRMQSAGNFLSLLG